MWCRDFNAHNTLWGSEKTGVNGQVIRDLLDETLERAPRGNHSYHYPDLCMMNFNASVIEVDREEKQVFGKANCEKFMGLQ